MTYVAEVDPATLSGQPLEPHHERLSDHPLRMPWARPRGPGADVAWAAARLGLAGRPLTGRAVQVGSWNLSSIWRLPTPAGHAWLKVEPPFFAHEGAVIERLQPHPVPRLLAREGSRMLLDEVPGEDLRSASEPVLRRMTATLVAIQCSPEAAVEAMLETGMPDWRAPALMPALRALVERWSPDLDAADREVLRAFTADLDQRLALVAACGVPVALVHGDFHPGNVRGDPLDPATPVTILDWADSGVGHPLLDEPAFLELVPVAVRADVRAAWHADWEHRVPGCDPARAAALLAPVAACRQALIYTRFLDAIEPSEHPYHAQDPLDWLRRTARILAGP